MIGDKYYTWSSYALMVMTICIGLFIFYQGGKFFDVGKTVSENKKEILETKSDVKETKAAAIIAKDTAITAKEQVDAIEKKLDSSVMQDKTTLETVLKGRVERYAAQELYLEELQKQRDKVVSLEKQINGVQSDHKKRLELMQCLVKEVNGLKAKLDQCVKEKN